MGRKFRIWPGLESRLNWNLPKLLFEFRLKPFVSELVNLIRNYAKDDHIICLFFMDVIGG